VAMTAFHFARPVIASRVGGLPEIVRDGVNGYLVPAEDPDALANAIDRFFSEADRGSMEHAAAETARASSWEDYANGFVRLVERP
jgi:glycosyltransferase involved in cell wall biosynthesis